MVLGGMTQQLLQLIKIDTQGEESLDSVIKKQRALQQQSRKTGEQLNGMAQGMEKTDNKSESASGQFGKMFGVGMNLMFMGMALQQVFGGLAGSMLKMTGVSETFGAAAQMVLLPFFLAITPLLNKIAFLFMRLPEPIKMALGAFVALMAVLGTFMFFGAQVALLAISLQISLLTLASALGTLLLSVFAIMVAVSTVYYIFKRFGAAAGIAAAAVGGALVVSLMSSTGAFQLLSLAIAKATGSTAALTASMFGLQISLTSILLAAGALALSLLLLDRIFKKFGPVVGLIATILGGVLLAALSPIAAIVFVIFGAFKAVNKILSKFSGIIKVAIAAVIAIIAVLVAVFVGTPLAIAAAVGAILAIIWSFKDEIIAVIKKVIDFVLNLPTHFSNALSSAGNLIDRFVKGAVSFFKDLWKDGKSFVGKLIDFITNLPNKIKNGLTNLGSVMMEIGESIINGVIDGIEGVGGSLKDAFFDQLPGPLSKAVKGISSFSGGLIGSIRDVLTPNDFILTSGGKMIQPASNDTIVGFNGDGAIQPGAGGGNVTVNINDPVMKEDVDVQRVVDEVEERVNRDTRGRTGGLGT